jgi:hypothetical protein
VTPPAAATVAGRRVVREPEVEYAPRAPRRVSGPVREQQARPEPRHRERPATRPSSRATAAAAALEAALAPAPAPAPTRTRREAPAPTRPRRETPRRTQAEPQRRVRTQQAPRLALRLRPPRLDRIVRGRAWIPVLGALLVAIVGLRVEVLKLGSGVGAQIQQATLLESSDSVLRSQISELSDNHRIITLAGDYGMYMPDPLDVHLVASAAGTHLGAAARNVSAPSRTTFLSGVATEQQAGGQGTQTVSSTTTSGVADATSSTANNTSGGAVSGTTNTSVASTTGADTTGATTSGLDTSSSRTGATSSSTTDALNSSTTGGGSNDVNTGLPDTTATSNTSQTTDSAGSTTGSTTGGTGLAG